MRHELSGKQDVYVEIAEKYKEYIRLGVLREGEKLPSVREAACLLGVNPNTVARAWARLEEEGFVITLPKKGAFVRAYESVNEQNAPSEIKVIYSLRDKGISKETLLEWIEEVYKND